MLLAPFAALLSLQTPHAAPRIPVFVWKRGDTPSALQREFGGAVLMRNEPAEPWTREQLDTFVFNAPGRNDLHLEREDARYRERWTRWLESRDERWLVREPCLTDPATIERLEHTLDQALVQRGTRTDRGVSLGDEIGLTPGGAPEDVCLSSTCRAAWTKWWKAEFGTLAPALESVSTDATLRALHDGDTQPIGAWLARRRFHQEVLLELVARLARRVRAFDSRTPVGLLGLAGQSAFGGVAVERVLPQLDFIECYRVGNARELAFTTRRPEQSVWSTAFCEARGPAASAHAVWDHWMRGGDGFVIWSEDELERAPEHARALLEAVRGVRQIDAEWSGYRPAPRGVAIVHRPRDVAAQWLRDALLDGSTWPKRFQSWQETHGTLESARKRWFDAAEEQAAMPGALPSSAISAATVARFPLLVLVQALVVDDVEIAALRSYVQAGGRLCIDGEFAWIDGAGRKHSEEQRQRWLTELAPVAPPEGFATLVEGVARRDATRAWWDARAVDRAPWLVSGAGAEHWTWSATWSERGDVVQGVLLPRVAAAPWPDQVELAARSGWRLAWTRPERDEHGRIACEPGSPILLVLERNQR